MSKMIYAETARSMLNSAIQINERTSAALRAKDIPHDQWLNLLKISSEVNGLIGMMSIVFISDTEVEQLPATDPAALAVAAQ